MADLTTEQAGQGTATPQVQTSAQPNSQQGAASENAQTQQPATEPQFVTLEQLSQFGEQIVTRMKQSDKDRTKRIEGEIASLRSTLSKANVTLAPEQEAKLREEIGNQIDGTEQPAQEDQSTPQADSVTEAQYIQGLFKGTESGTEVTPNDPEWVEWQKVYQDNFNDPSMQAASRVILATNKAAAAKAQRLKTNTDTAAARVMQGGSTSGAGDESGLDGHELFQRAHRK